MQISRNYRTDKTLLQLASTVYLGVIVIFLVGLLGCAHPRISLVEPENGILPMADSRDLPAVIKTLIEQADGQYQQKNLAGALATLERAVRINPRHPEVWSRMAKIYLKQGKTEQAQQHAKRSNSVLKNNDLLKLFNDQIISPETTENLY